METTERQWKFKQVFCHSSYPTYEEWKQVWEPNCICSYIGSYPTYEEWKLTIMSIHPLLPYLVLILPMRNGNLKNPPKNQSVQHRSYPTYEEWKPGNALLSSQRIFIVLILPMRNGNFFPYLLSTHIPFQFLSYLWGMETQIDLCRALCCLQRSYPTYEEWKHVISLSWKISVCLVLILPMRNGNKILRLAWETFLWVLILPMRNGNLNKFSIFKNKELGSYPTYEEWKPSFARCSISLISVLILPMRNGNEGFEIKNSNNLYSSYPTYEEWKPYNSYWAFQFYLSSYPTYEEWKLPPPFQFVLFFPRSYPTYEEWKLSILTLTNLAKWLWFLSYLWGMETICSSNFFLLSCMFLSYLWGMETFITS